MPFVDLIDVVPFNWVHLSSQWMPIHWLNRCHLPNQFNGLSTRRMPFNWVKCIHWVNGCHPLSQRMPSIELADAILLTQQIPSVKSIQWSVKSIWQSVNPMDAVLLSQVHLSSQRMPSIKSKDAVHWVNRCRSIDLMDAIHQINLTVHQLNGCHLLTWWMPFCWVECIHWVDGCRSINERWSGFLQESQVRGDCKHKK